jgi:hypothetical protein
MWSNTPPDSHEPKDAKPLTEHGQSARQIASLGVCQTIIEIDHDIRVLKKKDRDHASSSLLHVSIAVYFDYSDVHASVFCKRLRVSGSRTSCIEFVWPKLLCAQDRWISECRLIFVVLHGVWGGKCLGLPLFLNLYSDAVLQGQDQENKGTGIESPIFCYMQVPLPTNILKSADSVVSACSLPFGQTVWDHHRISCGSIPTLP